MSKESVAAVVLAAGRGTRMKSTLPKVLHPLAGRPMISHLLATVTELKAWPLVVVVAPGMDDVADSVAPVPVAVQERPLGTADAVKAARRILEKFTGDVLILFGDTPLVTVETMERLRAARRRSDDPAVVVLGMRPAGANEYGRLIGDDDGRLEAIVEWRDATAEQREVPLCNSGVMLVDGAMLFGLLDKVRNDNAKGEYYLTDIVEIARKEGRACAWVEGSETELLGINSRVELAAAEAVVQQQLRRRAMEGGVTMPMPESVHLSYDTQFGQDIVVGPFTVFGREVAVGDGVEIMGFCHFEQCRIEQGAVVGPFARLRPEAVIGEKAKIGNFVEVKKAVIESGAKVPHLTYIGDARVGAGANVGAGTITCNYDGFGKHFTDIGAGAFIGSNTSLVAPVKIGDGAVVGAGSTISEEVPADALVVERAKANVIPGWAAGRRTRKAAAPGASSKGKTSSNS